MKTIQDFVEECRSGALDRMIAKMPSGWAVMGDPQVLPGYCLLYPDPVPKDLNSCPDRDLFLADMARLGDAVLKATGAARINYEILGNLDPALHAHVVPRYSNEVEELRSKPVWFYDWPSSPAFDPTVHGELLQAIRERL